MLDKENGKLNLTSVQKTGAVLIFVFAILVVATGILQMRNNIYNPVALSFDKEDRTQPEFHADENTKLQNLDTDKDGLNDYDELNVYHTSPYLPDTDSDGFGDKEEIDSGTDPNCPEGDTCESAEASSATSTTNLSPIIGIPNPEQNGDLTIEELTEILQDPKKIREFLLDTGKITQEQLSQISDEQLMEITQRILLEEGLQGQQNIE